MKDAFNAVIKNKSYLGLLIVFGLIWDALISLSIFAVVFAIKQFSAFFNLQSDILTKYLDLVSTIGIIVIFILWLIYAILTIIKFIKSEMLSNQIDNTKEVSPDESGNARYWQHTSRFKAASYGKTSPLGNYL